jgi:hypothetical protein
LEERKTAMTGNTDEGPMDAVASGAKFVLEPKEVVSAVQYRYLCEKSAVGTAPHVTEP